MSGYGGGLGLGSPSMLEDRTIKIIKVKKLVNENIGKKLSQEIIDACKEATILKNLVCSFNGNDVRIHDMNDATNVSWSYIGDNVIHQYDQPSERFTVTSINYQDCFLIRTLLKE